MSMRRALTATATRALRVQLTTVAALRSTLSTTTQHCIARPSSSISHRAPFSTSSAAASSSPSVELLRDELEALGIDVDSLDAQTLRELEQLDLADIVADVSGENEDGSESAAAAAAFDDAEDEIDAKLLARLRAYRVHGSTDADADATDADADADDIEIDDDAIAASRVSALADDASVDYHDDYDPLDPEFVATDELRLNQETGEVELADQPSWLHLNTENPEWIPPIRAPGQVDASPSAPYPFVPVLRTTHDLKEASLLHRLLQYTRLNSARTFLRLERKRRELEHLRRYRNLYALNLRAPARRTDLDDPKLPKPAVKNLPANLPPAHLAVYHPHVITTDVEWIDEVMTEFKNELTTNETMSSAEKVKMLKLTHRMLLRCYWLMMKDKANGYYRITLGGPARRTNAAAGKSGQAGGSKKTSGGKVQRLYSSVLDELLQSQSQSQRR